MGFSQLTILSDLGTSFFVVDSAITVSCVDTMQVQYSGAKTSFALILIEERIASCL